MRDRKKSSVQGNFYTCNRGCINFSREGLMPLRQQRGDTWLKKGAI